MLFALEAHKKNKNAIVAGGNYMANRCVLSNVSGILYARKKFRERGAQKNLLMKHTQKYF